MGVFKRPKFRFCPVAFQGGSLNKLRKLGTPGGSFPSRLQGARDSAFPQQRAQLSMRARVAPRQASQNSTRWARPKASPSTSAATCPSSNGEPAVPKGLKDHRFLSGVLRVPSPRSRRLGPGARAAVLCAHLPFQQYYGRCFARLASSSPPPLLPASFSSPSPVFLFLCERPFCVRLKASSKPQGLVAPMPAPWL